MHAGVMQGNAGHESALVTLARVLAQAGSTVADRQVGRTVVQSPASVAFSFLPATAQSPDQGGAARSELPPIAASIAALGSSVAASVASSINLLCFHLLPGCVADPGPL